MSFSQLLDDLETALNTQTATVGTIYWGSVIDRNQVEGVSPHTVVNFEVVNDNFFSTQIRRQEIEFELVNYYLWNSGTSQYRTSKVQLLETYDRINAMDDVMQSFFKNMTCASVNETNPSHEKKTDNTKLEIITKFSITLDETRSA